MESVPTERSPKLLNLITGHFQEDGSYRSVRPKGSDSWLLIYTADGSGKVGDWRTIPGDWTLIRPNIKQDYGTAGEYWELIWCHFHPRPHWLPWLNRIDEADGLMNDSFPDHPELEALMESCHSLSQSGDLYADAFAMNRLEELLLRLSQLRRASHADLDIRIEESIRLISADLSIHRSISELAECAGLSPSRYSHLFRDQIGLSPGEFIERTRMDRAGGLLRLTELPIQSIASQVGFENPFYFTLRFKKHTGVSPTSYRHSRDSKDIGSQ